MYECLNDFVLTLVCENIKTVLWKFDCELYVKNMLPERF